MKTLKYLAVLLTALAVESKIVNKLHAHSFDPSVSQSGDPGGIRLLTTHDTHADSVQKNDAIQVTSLKEHGQEMRSTANRETSKDQLNSDIVMNSRLPFPQKNQVGLDLVANETWHTLYYDKTTNLQTWVLSLQHTEMVRTIYFKKKVSISRVLASTEVIFKVGNSTESQKNPICISGDADNPVQNCGLSGRYLNVIAAKTFFNNYDIMAFMSDVKQFDVQVDQTSSTTLLTLPDSMVVREVELFSSIENPLKNRLFIRSSSLRLHACALVEGPDSNKGLHFYGNQITIHTDRPFKPQEIMTIVNCDCFQSLTQSEIIFQDAYVGGQEQSISLHNRKILAKKLTNGCRQQRIKFTDHLTGLTILKWPFYGLIIDESSWQITLNPRENLDVGNHTLTLTISIDELVSKDVSITFQVKLAEKQEHHRILVGDSNCNVPASFLTLFDSTTIATQSDLGGGSIHSATGCDSVTLWDYTNTLAVQTTNAGPVNYWRAQLAQAMKVETVLFINQDDNMSTYNFSMGINPSVDQNQPCSNGTMIVDGGWYPCGLSGVYFGIWSTSQAVKFVEVQLYSQEAIQLHANSAVISVVDINYPVIRALQDKIVIYQYAGPPVRNNLCVFSGSIPAGMFANFTMVLRAQVQIDSVVVLCGDTYPTSWKVKCTESIRVSVQDVQNIKTACGADMLNYTNYSEAPCNKAGNVIIVEKTIAQSKMAMCGIAVLSSCDCNFSKWNLEQMPLNGVGLINKFSMATVVGVQAASNITINPNYQDTVSRVCGNADGVSKCGPRNITVTRGDGSNLQINMDPWKGVTFDQNTWQLNLFPKSAADVGVFTVVVRVALANFPLVSGTNTITITVTSNGNTFCKLPAGSMNLLNTAVNSTQSSYQTGYNGDPFQACDGVMQSKASPPSTSTVSTQNPPGVLNVWTAMFSVVQSVQSVLLINTDDLYRTRMAQSQLRIGNNADITLNAICTPTLIDGGWYVCVGSGTYFSVHSPSQTVYLVEVMLYSVYFIQMNAAAATISSQNPSYPATQTITSQVIVGLSRTNFCVSSSSSDDPEYLMTLKSQTKIKAIVLIAGNPEGCEGCGDWILNQQFVDIAVVNTLLEYQYCGNMVMDYNNYTEVNCTNAVGNVISVAKPGTAQTLSFCGVSILADCLCSQSSFDPAYSPLNSVPLSPTSTITYNVGQPPQTIALQYQMQDTVSRTCGNGDGLTFCGARTITVTAIQVPTNVNITSTAPFNGVVFQNNFLTVYTLLDSEVNSFVVRVSITLDANQTVNYFQDINITINARLPNMCMSSPADMNLLQTDVSVTQSSYVAGKNSMANVGCDGLLNATSVFGNVQAGAISPSTLRSWTAQFPKNTLVQTALIINVDDARVLNIMQQQLYVGNNADPLKNMLCNTGTTTDGGWWPCGESGLFFSIVSNTVDAVFQEVILYSFQAIQMKAYSVTMTTAAVQTGYIIPTTPISNIVVLATNSSYHSSSCILAQALSNAEYSVTLNSEVIIDGLVLLPVTASNIATDNHGVKMFVTNVAGDQTQCGSQIDDYSSYTERICNTPGNVVTVTKPGASTFWSFCSFGILSNCNCTASSFDLAKMPLLTDNFIQFPSMTVSINGTSLTNVVNQMQFDTVSRVCGLADGISYCGLRKFKLFDGATEIVNASYKGVLNVVLPNLVLSATLLDQITSFTLTVQVYLNDYPGVFRSVDIPIQVTNVITACSEPDASNSNLLASTTMSSQSGFISPFNTNAGVGCNTQIVTGTSGSFVFAPISTTQGSFWTADLITAKLIQTVLVVIDQQFISRISSSKLRVGSDVWPSKNAVCNEQMTAGGWWPCGLTGRYFSIHSTTVEVAFTEIMLFSYFSIQATAKEALSSGQDPGFPVANSLSNIVISDTTVANNCQKTNLVTDPSFQYTLNAPIVIQTLVLVPSVNSSWGPFQKDVTLCIKNSFTNTESCNTTATGNYASNYLQWQMNFEGDIIVVKKIGLEIVGFCSFGILSQCDCTATSFNLAKMPKFVINSNTLVGPTSLNSTIGEAEKTITILTQETVSQVCGKADGTFCGPKDLTFTDKTSGALISSWPYRGLTWDQSTLLLRFKPISQLDVGSFILKVTVSLQNYPAASQSTDIGVVVTSSQVTELCSTANITTASDLLFKISLTYYKDAAKSMAVPAVSDTQSKISGKALACGPYEYTASKGVEKVIPYDSTKQTVIFVTDNPDAISGTYDLYVSVGLKNWHTASPIIFKFSYTIEKCQVTSIAPDIATVTAIITIGDSPVSVSLPNWVTTPDCGYQPSSYKLLGDTSFVTQQPSQSEKTIKLGSNDTTIDLAMSTTIIVLPIYSSTVIPQLPSTLPPVQIQISFYVKQETPKNETVNTTYTRPNNNATFNATVKDLPPATVNFGKLNSKGNMSIKFSRDIVMPTLDIKEMTQLLFDPAMGLNSTHSRALRSGPSSVINTTQKLPNLQMKIIFDDPEKTQTAYKFEVSNITASAVTIQGVFEDPIQISQGFAADKLQIKVNSFEMFHTGDLKKVQVNSTEVIMSLPQMQVQATAFVGDMATTASDGSQIVMIILFIAKAFADFGLEALMDQMRALTLVVHLMCAGLMYPEVMSAFFGPLLSFLLIDIIPLSDWLQEAFNWEITPLTPNFDAMGYSSGYIMYNLGSLSMILVLTPVFALILKSLQKCKCLHHRIRAWTTKKYEGLVWNGLIATVDSNYFILLLCVLINIKTFDGNWGNDMLLNNIFGILSFFVVVSFPVVLFGLTWKYYDEIMDEESAARKQFGQHMAGYHKTRNSKRVVMASKFGVYVKAIMLCLAFVFLTEDPWAVMAINNFTTLYDIMFTVYYKPHDDPKENFFEAKANIVLMLFNYHMQLLTPFVSDPNMRFYVGCSACSVVALDLLLAVIFWAKDTCPSVRRFFRKKCIYEPALKKLSDAKLKARLEQIKQANEIEDNVAPGKHLRFKQVRDGSDQLSIFQQKATHQQQKRQQVLERIEENNSESKASSIQSHSELYSLRGGIGSNRMDARIIKVAAEIQLIKEKGLTKFGYLTNENLEDLGNLLPDDFETRSSRTRQFLVENLLAGFQEASLLQKSAQIEDNYEADMAAIEREVDQQNKTLIMDCDFIDIEMYQDNSIKAQNALDNLLIIQETLIKIPEKINLVNQRMQRLKNNVRQ